MSDVKYLSKDGVIYLWQKIKALMPKKTSDLENDSGFITTSDIPEGAAASTTTPKMNGTANVGTELAFARGDHVHPSDTNKVDKIAGKGLSTNDFTDALKQNYDTAYLYSQSPHAPSDAERNVLIGIQVNGADSPVDSTSRKTNIKVPTKTSDLVNDKGWITAKEVPETYVLPTASSTVLGGVKIGSNIGIANGVISVASGSTTAVGVVQLTDGVTSASTTTAATAKSVKTAYDLANSKQSPATSLSGYGITDAYTKSEVDAKVAGLVGSAPDLLNTLGELSDALGDDPNFATTVTNKIASKADASALANYVPTANAITNAEIDALFADA